MSDTEVLDSGEEVWCGSGKPMIAGYTPLPLSCTPQILVYTYRKTHPHSTDLLFSCKMGIMGVKHLLHPEDEQKIN